MPKSGGDRVNAEIARKIAFGMVLGIACLLGAGNRMQNAVADTPPQSAPTKTGEGQAGRNPFLVALEKKIEGQEKKPAEEVFKNVKLFKGMPAGRMLKVMEIAFSRSLGVDCTHCHVADEWEKEDREAKETARKMWAFVARTNENLKQEFGKGTVNCTTCHRGQVKPALNLPAAN